MPNAVRIDFSLSLKFQIPQLVSDKKFSHLALTSSVINPTKWIKTSFSQCRHENVSGYYRTSAYFFSKLFCDLLPYRTFPVIIYGTIVYWMMGENYKNVVTHNKFCLLDLSVATLWVAQCKQTLNLACYGWSSYKVNIVSKC